MAVIGVDPSLSSTGIVVLTSDGRQTLHCCAVQPDRRLRPPERWFLIASAMLQAADEYGAGLLTIEGYGYASASGVALGELGGVLRYEAYRHGLRCLEVAPVLVKKWATGKGNAPKEQIMLAVYKRYGMEFGTDDECDAFVLAQIGAAFVAVEMDSRQLDNYPRHQQEVLQKLRSAKE